MKDEIKIINNTTDNQQKNARKIFETLLHIINTENHNGHNSISSWLYWKAKSSDAKRIETSPLEGTGVVPRFYTVPHLHDQ